MKYITLSNGFVLPIIGMGTYPQKEVLKELIPKAVQLGYTMFDTSDNYMNEEFYGQGYYRAIDDGDNLITITKFSSPYEDFRWVYEKSIKNIYNSNQRGKLVYLLHWPYPHLYPQIWEFMEELYIEGKCEAIGVCNFETKHLSVLLENCRIKPMINQIECHPLFSQRDICRMCEENDIQIMAYSPIARMDSRLISHHFLNELAKKYAKSVVQIILRWHIEQGRIIIPATKNQDRLEENIDLFDFKLTPQEVEKIDGLECGLRIRFNPNERFSEDEISAMKRESLFVNTKRKTDNTKIIIYGAGTYGRQLYRFLTRLGTRIDFFCQTLAGEMDVIYETPVITMDELENLEGNKIVLIAIENEKISHTIKQNIEKKILHDVAIYECAKLVKTFYPQNK